MSENKKNRVSFEEMQFYHEIAIRNALDQLFNSDNTHGWTEVEYNNANADMIMDRIRNSVEGQQDEQYLH